jgi:succinate dehydrogenase hydrophobic anchor subunit
MDLSNLYGLIPFLMIGLFMYAIWVITEDYSKKFRIILQIILFISLILVILFNPELIYLNKV